MGDIFECKILKAEYTICEKKPVINRFCCPGLKIGYDVSRCTVPCKKIHIITDS